MQDLRLFDETELSELSRQFFSTQEWHEDLLVEGVQLQVDLVNGEAVGVVFVRAANSNDFGGSLESHDNCHTATVYKVNWLYFCICLVHIMWRIGRFTAEGHTEGEPMMPDGRAEVPLGRRQERRT